MTGSVPDRRENDGEQGVAAGRDQARDELAADVVGQMVAITRRVRRHARVDLEPLNLTPAQVRALRVVFRLGAHDGPRPDACDGCRLDGPGVRMGEVAAALDVVPRSATDVVAALEARSLLRRVPDPADGRAVIVTVTPTGHRLLDHLHDRHRDAAAEALDALDLADLWALADLLHRAVGPAEP